MNEARVHLRRIKNNDNNLIMQMYAPESVHRWVKLRSNVTCGR